MQKECEICGVFFEAKMQTRKYCDNCQNHAGKKKIAYNDAVRQSKLRMGEFEKIPYDIVCEKCGKKYIAIPGKEWKATAPRQSHYKIFCSKKCRNAFILEEYKCKTCGKSLKDTDYCDIDKARSYNDLYCSLECEAADKGWEKICANCGKIFIRANRKETNYCSRECYIEYQKRNHSN